MNTWHSRFEWPGASLVLAPLPVALPLARSLPILLEKPQ